MNRTHRWPVRVYYEDTDSGRIVYHANYLKYAERARSELLREIGLPNRVVAERWQMGFAVRRCAMDFRLPAVLDDELHVESRLTHIGGARVKAIQDVCRGADLLVRVDVEIVCLGHEGRAVRLPKDVAAAMTPYLHERSE